MKKYLICFGIALTLLVACNKNDTPSPNEQSGLAVAFQAQIADKLDDWGGELDNRTRQTRGAVSNNATLQQFGAYCFYTGTSLWGDLAATALPDKMYNVAVTRSTLGGPEWTYPQPLKWGEGVNNHNFTFFGYAPLAAGTYDQNANTSGNNLSLLKAETDPGMPKMEYSTLDYVPMQIDLLFAKPVYNTYPVARVIMKFSHALSQIRFKAWSERDFVKVTSIKISSVQYAGTFDADGTLTRDASLKTKDFKLIDLDAYLSSDQTQMTDLTAGGNVFMLLPQDLTGNTTAQIVVEYEMAGQTHSSIPYTITQNWEKGKSYNYSLKLGEAPTEEMVVTGVNVTDWVLDGEEDMEATPPALLADPANCYIVAPGEKVIFDPRVQGNGGAGAVAIAPQSVQVLWQDRGNPTPVIKSVAFAGGKATVTANGNAGNAVVAAYSGPGGTGDILWSWHIWVTDYAPDGAKNYGLAADSKADVTGGQVHTYGAQYMVTNAGKVIMDRNLGATKTYYAAPAALDATADQSFGMFYQWGRKDPFPRVLGSSIVAADATGTTIPIYGSDGTKLGDEVSDAAGTGYRKMNITGAGIMGATNTLAYAVKNPLAFIYNGKTPYDWYTTTADNQDNSLWGDGALKSVYDPCPTGWRIAPNGTWSDFTRDATTPANGTFPYYSDGVIGETYGAGNYKATNGRYYAAAGVWYPAPGFRERVSGALYSVGNNGYSWSSAVNSVYGLDFLFHTQGLNPSSTQSRTTGLTVRCIQE